jgi:hypothetical protein
MPTRQTRAWKTVAVAATWQDGVALVDAFTDDGANPSASWRGLGGGESGQRKMFGCTAHKKCKAEVRLVTSKTMEIWLQKCTDEKHKRSTVLYDRANSTLTKMQKAEADAGLRYGASAHDIFIEEGLKQFDLGNPVEMDRNGAQHVRGARIA